MSRLCAHLLALCTALLLPGCLELPPQVPPPLPPSTLGPWVGQLSLPPEPFGPCLFKPAEDNFRRELHDACRRCASVEFVMENTATPFRRQATRQELEGALSALLALEQWYVRRTPEGMCVYPRNCPGVRFLDAEGKHILTLRYYPAADGFVNVPESTWARCYPELAACIKGGERYLSVWDIFATWLAPSAPAERAAQP